MKIFNRGQAAIVTIDTRICPKSYVEIPDETAYKLEKMYPELLLVRETKLDTAKIDAANAALKVIEDSIAAKKAELEKLNEVPVQVKTGRAKK